MDMTSSRRDAEDMALVVVAALAVIALVGSIVAYSLSSLLGYIFR